MDYKGAPEPLAFLSCRACSTRKRLLMVCEVIHWNANREQARSKPCCGRETAAASDSLASRALVCRAGEFAETITFTFHGQLQLVPQLISSMLVEEFSSSAKLAAPPLSKPPSRSAVLTHCGPRADEQASIPLTMYTSLGFPVLWSASGALSWASSQVPSQLRAPPQTRPSHWPCPY